MSYLCDEANFLIPKWEDLIENANYDKTVVDSFKPLFKETYEYFKDFKEEVYDGQYLNSMSVELFHAHLSLVNLLTIFEMEIRYSEHIKVQKYSQVVFSFLEHYVLTNKFHGTYGNNTVAVKTLVPDEYWYYNVKTGKLSE